VRNVTRSLEMSAGIFAAHHSFSLLAFIQRERAPARLDVRREHTLARSVRSA
jgi:hypothetical protein